jgi:hypothetical protein
MLNVHAAGSCCMDLLHVHAAYQCYMSMMSMLHVHTACPHCMSMLHVHTACQCCTILHVHAACPRCMSTLHCFSKILPKFQLNKPLMSLHFGEISFRRNFVSAKFRFCKISFRGNPTLRLSYFVRFVELFLQNKYIVISFQQNFVKMSAK